MNQATYALTPGLPGAPAILSVRFLVQEEQVPNIGLIAYDSGKLTISLPGSNQTLDFESPIDLQSVTMTINPENPPSPGYTRILIQAKVATRLNKVAVFLT